MTSRRTPKRIGWRGFRREAQHLLRLGMAPEEIENAVRQTALALAEESSE
jgi:hypothetical protein